MAANKTICKQEGTKLLEPHTWCLFQTIKSLRQLANMSGKLRISEAMRLFHVDGFSKVPMKKCVFDI